MNGKLGNSNKVRAFTNFQPVFLQPRKRHFPTENTFCVIGHVYMPHRWGYTLRAALDNAGFTFRNELLSVMEVVAAVAVGVQVVAMMKMKSLMVVVEQMKWWSGVTRLSGSHRQ